MGELIRPGGDSVQLPSRLVVGRSHEVGLRISESSVSNEHAVLTWQGDRWHIHDLGSTNGTRLNGRLLQPGGTQVLALEDELSFGLLPDKYRLVDNAPPRLFAKNLSDGRVVEAVAGVIALPSAETPIVQVLPIGGETWVCCSDGAESPIEEGEVVLAADQKWRIFLPVGEEQTRRVEDGLKLWELTLIFKVSQDEEVVVIELKSERCSIVMEARAHNYLLLCLGRQLLKDKELPREARGWVDKGEISRQLKLAPEHLNVQLFRLRQCFADAGVVDSGNLVESRRRPSGVRIGIQSLVIQSL